MTDANGVLSAVYDPVLQQLLTENVGVNSGKSLPTDQNGVWAAVFDQATGMLRVVTV